MHKLTSLSARSMVTSINISKEIFFYINNSRILSAIVGFYILHWCQTSTEKNGALKLKLNLSNIHQNKIFQPQCYGFDKGEKKTKSNDNLSFQKIITWIGYVYLQVCNFGWNEEIVVNPNLVTPFWSLRHNSCNSHTFQI